MPLIGRSASAQRAVALVHTRTSTTAMEEEDRLDGRRITRKEATERPTRSFRHEDYSTRRVFLRSYPLQWEWSPAAGDGHQQGQGGGGGGASKNGTDDGGGGGDDGDEGCGRRWRRQVAEAVVEWGEEKLLLLRRAKKRVALYLLGCHYGRRPALTFKSGGSGSCTAAMLTSR